MPTNSAAFTEARDRLREILDDVETTGSEWVITRHGRQVAVVLSYEEYEALVETVNILSDPETVAAIEEARLDLEEGRVEEG